MYTRTHRHTNTARPASPCSTSAAFPASCSCSCYSSCGRSHGKNLHSIRTHGINYSPADAELPFLMKADPLSALCSNASFLLSDLLFCFCPHSPLSLSSPALIFHELNNHSRNPLFCRPCVHVAGDGRTSEKGLELAVIGSRSRQVPARLRGHIIGDKLQTFVEDVTRLQSVEEREEEIV